MARKGGDVIFRLLGDDSHLKKSLDSTRGTFQDMVRQFATMPLGGLLGRIAPVASLGMAIREITNQALGFDTAHAQLEATLKSTGSAAGVTSTALKDLAASMRNQTAFAQADVANVENLLLTFTNLKGEIYTGALRAVLDVSTAMKTDLKSASLQVGKALNDPIRGISALAEVGVTFTTKQRDLVQSLMGSGMVMQAQQIILDELAKEFGGSATASVDTFSGALARLKNAMIDIPAEALSTKIGNVTAAINVGTDIVTGSMPSDKTTESTYYKAATSPVGKAVAWPATLGSWFSEAMNSLGEHVFGEEVRTFQETGRRAGLSDDSLARMVAGARRGITNNERSQPATMDFTPEEQSLIRKSLQEQKAKAQQVTNINQNVTISHANFTAGDDMVQKLNRKIAMAPGV